jgi:uncharacterized RDD family membrane protein YckC/Tfp pilus assembly major pilin PilA
MQDAIWYYGDAAGQHGPVTAQGLRDGLADGSVPAQGLFWREGLADWVPLALIAAEIGIEAETSSAPPSAPPATPPPTSEGASPEAVVPAGFLRRWAAHIVDRAILLVPFCVIAFFAAVYVGDRMLQGDFAGFWIVFALVPLYFVASALYHAGQESSSRQATLGKRALGIKVTDDAGRRLRFSHALGRWFATALSYLTFDVGFLMAAFTERRQALHDLVAKTHVVDRWAYTDHPERQQRGTSGCLVALLVALVVGLVLIPILAAISVGQYEDYGARAQVLEGSSLADGARTAVGEAFQTTGKLPSSNAAAGLPSPEEMQGQYVSAVTVHEGGRIEATFATTDQVATPLRGTRLEFVPVTGDTGIVEWRCRSDSIPQKVCPRGCACR